MPPAPANAHPLSGAALMSRAGLSPSSAVGTGDSNPSGPKAPADDRPLSLQSPVGEPRFGSPTLRKTFSACQRLLSFFQPVPESRQPYLGLSCYCPSHSGTAGTLGHCSRELSPHSWHPSPTLCVHGAAGHLPALAKTHCGPGTFGRLSHSFPLNLKGGINAATRS